MLIDDDIIKNQCKKEDRDANESDQDGLCKFTEPGFAENFAIGPHQGKKDEPEKRDDSYSVIEFFIKDNVVQMGENLVINCIFAVDEEQGPGHESRQEISSNIFNNL